jgi:hypothetical protein
VIAEHHERGNLCELRDLIGRQIRAGHLDRDHPADAGGILQRGLLREEAGLGVSHQDRALQLHGQRRHVLPGRIRIRQQRVEVRDHLFVELVDGFDWKLSVGEGFAKFRTEAEHRPRDLLAGVDDVRQRARRLRTRFHGADRRGIEPRTRTRDLIGEIHRSIAAHEVPVPSHPPVRRRLHVLLLRQQPWTITTGR